MDYYIRKPSWRHEHGCPSCVYRGSFRHEEHDGREGVIYDVYTDDGTVVMRYGDHEEELTTSLESVMATPAGAPNYKKTRRLLQKHEDLPGEVRPDIFYVRAKRRHSYDDVQERHLHHSTDITEVEQWAQRLRQASQYAEPFMRHKAEYENEVVRNEDGEPVRIREDQPANDAAKQLRERRAVGVSEPTYSVGRLDREHVETILDALNLSHN